MSILLKHKVFFCNDFAMLGVKNVQSFAMSTMTWTYLFYFAALLPTRFVTKCFIGKVISSQDRVTWKIAPITNNLISQSKIREKEGMRETQFLLRIIVNTEQMYRKIRRTILRFGHVCSKWPKSKTLNHFWLRQSWGHIWIFLKSVDLMLLGNHWITFNFWL